MGYSSRPSIMPYSRRSLIPLYLLLSVLVRKNADFIFSSSFLISCASGVTPDFSIRSTGQNKFLPPASSTVFKIYLRRLRNLSSESNTLCLMLTKDVIALTSFILVFALGFIPFFSATKSHIVLRPSMVSSQSTMHLIYACLHRRCLTPKQVVYV